MKSFPAFADEQMQALQSRDCSWRMMIVPEAAPPGGVFVLLLFGLGIRNPASNDVGSR
jgi:hypothetical protein